MIKRDVLIKKIENLKNGKFFRIRYMTNMKVLAEYANKGVQVIKIVETTSRTGIKYSNIKGVNSEYPLEYVAKKPTAWTWVIKNKVKYNDNTKKEYLCLYPVHRIESSNSKVRYMLINGELDKTFIYDNLADVEMYIRPSQLHNSNPARMINIELSNILSIN